MKKIIFLSGALLLCVHLLKAQNIAARIAGNPITNSVKNNIEGTPYLAPDFSAGTFVLSGGKTSVNGLQIKYNIFEDVVSYKDEKGNELISVEPVGRFIIEHKGQQQIYQKGFPEIEKWNANTYYEVLNTGETAPMLLKKHIKTLMSRKEYNSAKTTDTYLDGTKYYVFTEAGELVKFKADKKTLPTYFPKKQAEMAAYIAKNDVDLKSDQDLGKIFDYYSSINK